MDPWQIVTQEGCKHLRVEVEPGPTEHDPCVGYCRDCGEPVEVGMSWYWYKVEADFNQWARETSETSRRPQRGDPAP